jgi:hypothetical protein
MSIPRSPRHLKTSSVSESPEGPRRPAASGGVCPVTWADDGPVVTGVVRCDPVACGPDVAPMWPQRSGQGLPLLERAVVGGGADMGVGAHVDDMLGSVGDLEADSVVARLRAAG